MTKPHPCTLANHEVSRNWSLPKDGTTECVCICWTCTDKLKAGSDHRLKSWREVWKLDKVEIG